MVRVTGKQLADYGVSMIGHPYWYGTYGQKASTSLLTSKSKQYPSHYPARMATQRKKEAASGVTVVDCYGLIKGKLWMDETGKIVYGSNGVKDTNANGIYAAAKIKGAIKTIPEIIGLLVWSDGHIGIYIGGGYVIEARGRNYGVVKTKLSARSWTHWLQHPQVDYTGTSTGSEPAGVFGEYSIVRGDVGDNVRTLQAMKYALIFIASAPMLIAYPFVQKYFVKGVMIGSLKG